MLEQAKGVLIERHGWDANRAFKQLVTMSQRTNTKLTELAALVVQDAAVNRATSPTDEAWAYRLIDLLVTPAMVLAPIRDERGLLTDFRIQHANPTTTDLVGRTADGWVPSSGWATPDKLPGMHARIDEAAAAAGRDPADIRRVYNVWGVIGGSGGFLHGGVDQWVEELTGLVLEHGMDTFVFGPSENPVAQLERFVADVAPAVREQVTSHRR